MNEEDVRYVEVQLTVLFRRVALITVKAPKDMADSEIARLAQERYDGSTAWEEDELFSQPQTPVVVGESDDAEDVDLTGTEGPHEPGS